MLRSRQIVTLSLLSVLSVLSVRGISVGVNVNSCASAATQLPSEQQQQQQEQHQQGANDEHMDTNVEPCDDFYEYACGNWRVSYSLRLLGARDVLTLVRALNKDLLMQALENQTQLQSQQNHQQQQQPQQGLNDPSYRGMYDFYSSCLSVQLRSTNRDAIRVYTDALHHFSTWPVLDAAFTEQAANASFHWQHMSAQLRRYGTQSFWRLIVQSNWQAAEQRIFYMMPPSFDLLKPSADKADGSAHVQEEAAFLYRRYIKYLLLDLGVRVRTASSIASEVVEFETQLLALSPARDHTYVLREPQPLRALMRDLPDLRLEEYFETLLAQLPLPADYAHKLLIVADTNYLAKLGQLLRHTSAELIGKYLLVQFLAHFEVHLHDDKTFNEQREHCLQQLNDFMPLELTRLYLQLLHEHEQQQQGPASTSTNKANSFLYDTQQQLSGYFEQLKWHFEHALNTTKIFEGETASRQLGLEKLRAMQLLLQPAESVVESSARTATVEAEAEAEADRDNYDQHLLRLSQTRAVMELQQVVIALHANDANDGNNAKGGVVAATSNSSKTTSVHGVHSVRGPLDVNAYYRLKSNVIELPVGLLRPPLWQGCEQMAPRIYGSLVYILAHELLHGFDYDGLNYDKSGNVANNWSAKAIIKYGTRSACYLAPRYSNAAINLNENIADSEGLRLALSALQRARAQDQQQPAATLTNAELKTFFLAFAQNWCGHAAPTTLATQHTAHRERVNNVLGNFPEFTEVYKCKAQSPLSLDDKCRIW